MKKLTEGLQFYRDKLHEPKVFERFQQILDKARQNKSKDKPDAELDEFEKVGTLWAIALNSVGLISDIDTRRAQGTGSGRPSAPGQSREEGEEAGQSRWERYGSALIILAAYRLIGLVCWRRSGKEGGAYSGRGRVK